MAAGAHAGTDNAHAQGNDIPPGRHAVLDQLPRATESRFTLLCSAISVDATGSRRCNDASQRWVPSHSTIESSATDTSRDVPQWEQYDLISVRSPWCSRACLKVGDWVMSLPAVNEFCRFHAPEEWRAGTAGDCLSVVRGPIIFGIGYQSVADYLCGNQAP